jgi:hypothetical protein
MRQRGRKTTDTLVAMATESGDPKPRLDPPDCLGVRECAEWRAIVQRFGPDMFPHETRALLATLCGILVNLNDLNLEMAAREPGIPTDRSGWNQFRHLIRLRGQLATQATMIETKLRIIPTSRDVRRTRTTEYERQLEDDGDIKPWNDNVN